MTTGAVAYIRSNQPDAKNREKDDFYPTPREAIDALIAAEKFTGPIWECACGDGAISKPLIEAGYDVVSSDLVDRGYGETGVDFLMEWQPRGRDIITNPPFKLAEQFVLHALSLTTGKVAVLCRLAWLEGRARHDSIFSRTPLAKVLVFSSRLRMQRGRQANDQDTGGSIAFAWFVWQHGYQGSPRLGWL